MRVGTVRNREGKTLLRRIGAKKSRCAPPQNCGAPPDGLWRCAETSSAWPSRSALRQLWMPQRPKPLVRCDKGSPRPTISQWGAAPPLGHKFEHLQQGHRDFDVPLIAGIMEGDQDLVGNAPGAPGPSIKTAAIDGPSAARAVAVDRIPNDTISGVRIVHQSAPFELDIFDDNQKV